MIMNHGSTLLASFHHPKSKGKLGSSIWIFEEISFGQPTIAPRPHGLSTFSLIGTCLDVSQEWGSPSTLTCTIV